MTKLAKSKSLWERRISMVATFYGIAKNDLNETYRIAELLLSDNHDLMHKAVGWALREAGKKDKVSLEQFLTKHASMMPRTSLRYSIERFTPKERERYMKMKSLVARAK